MRSKKNVETIKLEEGMFHEIEFDNYLDMAKHAVEWTLLCSYELKPNSLDGLYKILSLPNIQIAYSHLHGSLMYDYIGPIDSINITIVPLIANRSCLDQMKLKTDMIVITDDKKPYILMYNDEVKFLDVSLKKSVYPSLYNRLADAVDRYFIDRDQKLSHLLMRVLDTYSEGKTALTLQISMQIEAQVVDAMIDILEEQEANTPHFTKSEKIALTMRKEFFDHMDGPIDIASLSVKHQISEKSLQNAFKSLFGFTPKLFFRLTKLNLVHHELIHSNSKEISVMRVAHKWGFKHMGKFSKYYTELFGENPSVTLKSVDPMIDGINEHCVERKEEIE
jgi:AraC-like DNA-binding protein